MTVGSLNLYNGNGRMRGSFVYMLLCHEAGHDIYVKAGLTDTPDKRLTALRVACPITPRLFYTAEVESRDKAKRLEAELLHVFQPWHHNGEWFKVPIEDKAEFNQSWKIAFASFHSPSWPLSWSKIAVEPLAELAKRRGRFVRMRYAKRGKAYQDFTTDSAKDLRQL